MKPIRFVVAILLAASCMAGCENHETQQQQADRFLNGAKTTRLVEGEGKPQSAQEPNRQEKLDKFYGKDNSARAK